MDCGQLGGFLFVLSLHFENSISHPGCLQTILNNTTNPNFIMKIISLRAFAQKSQDLWGLKVLGFLGLKKGLEGVGSINRPEK